MTLKQDVNKAMTLDRYRKILEYYPDMYHESLLIQTLSYKVGSETSSRIIDLLDFIRDNSRPTSATTFLIPEWERMLRLPSNPSQTINLRRSLVANRFSRADRHRIIDIATICRRYLTGLIGYTRRLVYEDNIIPVTTVSGISVGMTLWIGSAEAIVTSIDPANRLVTVNQNISAPTFSVVSSSYVLIVDEPSAYRFRIFLDPDQIADINGLIAAVHEAKPAHLGFVIYGFPGLGYEEEGMSWEGSFTDFPYDEDEIYDEDAPYDEDPGEISYWEGSAVFYTTDPEE